MTVRLTQQEIGEAVREYLRHRGIIPRENVHFTWRGCASHSESLDAVVAIEMPRKDGPCR